MTEMETTISIGDADPHFYLCGRLLGKSKAVVIPIFASALSVAWNLKERLLVREEVPGLFVFQFKSRTERDWVVGRGSWSFNGCMIILAEYDGLKPVEDVLLNKLEVWISVAGLRFAMRNHQVLGRVGNDLGGFVRAYPGPIKRKEKIQRVRVVLDVRNRIPAEHIFNFSSEISVKLSLKVERTHGICRECGFFGHGGGTCDRGLLCGLPVVDEGMADEALTCVGELEMQVAVEKPEFPAEEAVSTELEDGLESSRPASAMVEALPTFSAGNPSFKLGLTEPRGLTEDAGPERANGLCGCGLGRLKRKVGFGTDLVFSEDGPSGPILGKKHKLGALSPSASPEKLAISNGEGRLSSLKKLNTPTPRITARALGLLDEGKSSVSGNGMGVEGKKKRGRPLGSKNLKNLQVQEKKDKEGGMTMQAGNVQPSPNPKGKDVL